MQITKYEKLIPENIAPYNAKRIGIYRKNTNTRVGGFGLQNLRPTNLGKKLYSFGALSDIHLQYSTAQEDFQRALTYLNETEDVEFTCICGDLTDNGQDADFEAYAEYVNTYSPNTPVYECTGNHDAYDNLIGFDKMQPYTGHDLYYTFTQGDDLFIMFGTQYYDTTGKVLKPFSQESLQWLYETLEANRNKRVFLFQHYLRFDGSGKPYSPNPTGDVLGYCTEGTVFNSLMEHYTNVVWFHGHSHTKFDCQLDCSYANYDRMHGCHSVHIPSLAVPRDYENDEYVSKYAESEGYVVDVYENHIVLRGRDFVREEFLPIAIYYLDTSLQTIEANTFTDSTGTITI
jgi:predicted phosphodiesterase